MFCKYFLCIIGTGSMARWTNVLWTLLFDIILYLSLDSSTSDSDSREIFQDMKGKNEAKATVLEGSLYLRNR